MSTTHLRQHVRAPRAAVYAALTTAADVGVWMVPDGMTGEIHVFEPVEGGRVRMSLTYEDQDAQGKSGAHTDTWHGRFVALEPDRRVVQTCEFESDDPGMQGEMTMTFALEEANGGTDVVATHENLPPALPQADNDLGWALSLEKLAKLVEGRQNAT